MDDKKELYDIEPKEFYIESRNESDNMYYYVLSPVNRPPYCPICKSTNIIRHGLAPRDIRDTSSHGHLVGFTVKAHRYYCKSCKGSFVDQFESIEGDDKVTKRLREYIKQESLVRPFDSIAHELGISDTTVRTTFLKYVTEIDQNRKIETPTVLGIDENHLYGQYRAVFVNMDTRMLIEMLPDRKKPNIKKFIKSLQNYDTTIRCVTCDMYKNYRDAAYECIPNVVVIVDKFHVIKELTNALENTRRQLKQDIDKEEYKYLRRSRGLMLKNSEDLTFEQAKALYRIFDRFPVFKKPHELKEEFRNIYLESKDRKGAEKRFDKWKESVVGYPLFEDVANIVDNWHKEIFNYFDHNYTNATTESINNLINNVANSGRGYSFEVLRYKCLYGLKTKKPNTYSFKDFHSNKEN